MSRKRFKTKIKSYFTLLVATVVVAAGFFVSVRPFASAVELTAESSYSEELWNLNQQINDKRKESEQLKKQVDVYTKSLASKRREIATLNYQLATISQTITKISLEKETIEVEIEEINLQIRNSQLKIQATEEQLAGQKEQLAELIRTLYQSDKRDNLLIILATKDSLSEYLTEIQNIQSLQSSVMNGLDGLNELKLALINEQDGLDDNKNQLNDLNAELDVKAASLSEQKDVKNLLVEETRGQESKYQQLLEELKAEQNRINNDIVSLEQVAREKLNRQLKAGSKDLGSGPMIWPVPSREITAYFHDPDYPYRNVFEHPAIDIRSPQGSAVYAASSGYVARAKDSGMGYSYIMLIHDNGISTVYGHVSGIAVTEGSFVTQGQIIGYSGGKPGTPGAGRLTTGPHLHFEVRLNGIPVNPINYLP